MASARTPSAADARRKAVASYVASGLAANTQRAYAADLQHFRAWGGRIPATSAMVAAYLVAHAKRLKISTLTRRLAAIANAHTLLGRDSPTRSPLIRATLRGIRRVHGSAQVQAKPITPSMLRVMTRARRGHCSIRATRDRALLLVGFAGGFRRSELVQLTPSDLTFSRAGVAIMLRRSKTDPHAKGRLVALPSSAGDLCPVKALKAWLAVLQHRCLDQEAAPLFRRIDRHGHICSKLGAAGVGWILRQRMALCGISITGYSAHSLRAGLVTSAALSGVPVWAIQRQTGHRSEATVHRYIRDVSPFEANAYRSIAQSSL
jgi:integrase